jgi:membrane protease YdiL (CAAX protease family)
LAIAAGLALVGLGPEEGRMTLGYVVALSLVDSIVLVILVCWFLRAGGDSPRAVLLDERPVLAEAAAGLPLTLLALALAVIVLLLVRELAPWLRTFERNPFQDLVQTPADTAVFALVVVVAGGIREEIQRAFLLIRFDRFLGGTAVGIAVTSVAFGAGHFVQGADAAIATGLLGAFWAVIYVRRRSIVAPVVSHSGFNLIQLTQFFV